MNRRRNQSMAVSKMIGVNDKFGNTGIKNQQGTTRIIYDALELVAHAEAFTLIFFENVNTRLFPFTNLLENKLQVGETIALEDYYFNIAEVTPKNVVLYERPLEYFTETEGLYRADLDFMIGESRVLKGVKIGSSQASFNYGANFLMQNPIQISSAGGDPLLSTVTKAEKGHVIYNLRTDLVIPPDIQFTAPVKFSGNIALPKKQNDANKFYIFLTMEGRGSLLAMRTTV